MNANDTGSNYELELNHVTRLRCRLQMRKAMWSREYLSLTIIICNYRADVRAEIWGETSWTPSIIGCDFCSRVELLVYTSNSADNRKFIKLHSFFQKNKMLVSLHGIKLWKVGKQCNFQRQARYLTMKHISLNSPWHRSCRCVRDSLHVHSLCESD